MNTESCQISEEISHEKEGEASLKGPQKCSEGRRKLSEGRGLFLGLETVTRVKRRRLDCGYNSSIILVQDSLVLGLDIRPTRPPKSSEEISLSSEGERTLIH